MAVLGICPPKAVIYAEKKAVAKGGLKVFIENMGRVPIRIERVGMRVAPKGARLDPSQSIRWLTPDPNAETVGGSTLQPKDRLTWNVKIPTMLEAGMRTDRSGELHLDTSIGRRVVPIEVKPAFIFDVRLRPKLLVGTATRAVELWLYGRAGDGIIQRIESTVPWVRIANASLPITLERNTHESLEVFIDCDHMPKTSDRTFGARFKVKYIDQPIEKEIPFRWAPQPELDIQGENPSYREMLKGERGVAMHWGLANPGGPDGLAIEIASIQVVGQAADALEITKPDSPSTPVTIRTDSNVPLEVVAIPKKLPPGLHTAELLIKWGSRGDIQDPKRIPVTLDVKPMPTEGLVAIDFGTTSSCCAVWDNKKGKLVFVELETGESYSQSQRRVSATAIIYQRDKDAQSGVRPWLFGEQARGNARNPKYYGSSVLSIKRRLGSEDPCRIQVEDWATDLTPEDIAADILRDLREKIVYSPMARSEPEDLVVSVPAMSSRFQCEALAKALQTAGLPSVDAREMVDEPIAAAASFFFKKKDLRKYKLPDCYSLLVCDIGGGTTDICLLRVTDTTPSKGPVKRDLKVEILAMGGNPQFGGDDITDLLAREILRRYQEHKPALEDAPYDHDLADQGREKIADHNRGQLLKRAEDAKIALSKEKEYTLPGAFHLKSRAGELVEVDTITLTPQDLQDLVEADIEVIENIIAGQMEYVRKHLDLEKAEVTTKKKTEVATNKKAEIPTKDDDKLFPNDCPRVLLLAGRTMNVPMIRKRLQARFGGNKTEFDSDFCKECVVDGATRVWHYEKYPSPEVKFLRISKENCSSVAVGIGVGGTGGEMVMYPIIQQFADLDQWHYKTFAIPKTPKVKYEVYENYAPFAFDRLKGNHMVRYLGMARFEIPEEILQQAKEHEQQAKEHEQQAKGDEPKPSPFEIGMKLDRAGRELKIEVRIIPHSDGHDPDQTQPWNQIVDLSRASGRG